MGGVSVDGGGKGGRRSLDSEINMIPMIDFLMVTISFLLITAVWSNMARINASAQVPGPPREAPIDPTPPEKQLHIQMNGTDKFVLIWKQGSTEVIREEITRKDDLKVDGNKKKTIRFKELAEKIEAGWKVQGSHRDGADKKLDLAVLHTDNETPYVYLVAVIDAIYSAQRPMNVGGKVEQIPAFNVTFAVN
jgi:biopolymer transport protein ExbD